MSAHDNEVKHVRKTYEKTALELAVVRRFQSPVGESFDRLSSVFRRLKGTDPVQGQGAVLGKPVKSAPALVHLTSSKSSHGRAVNGFDSGNTSNTRTPASQAYVHDPDELANSSDSVDILQRAKSQHPSQRILSTSDEVPNGHIQAGVELEDHSLLAESELMIRRFWESREVATSA